MEINIGNALLGIFQAKDSEKLVVPNGREFELPNLSVSHYLHTDEALE